MLHIDIELSHPRLTAALLMGAAVFVWGAQSDAMQTALGGPERADLLAVHEEERRMEELRSEQAVLLKREDILRADLALLEEEELRGGSTVTLQELQSARRELVLLLQDKQRAEEAIRTSLLQIWEAQGAGRAAARMDGTGTRPNFVWPVHPTLGISAFFEDPAYQNRFGIPHHAIDIPVIQGTTVRAPADGVVAKVSDNGLGYNSIVLRHDGGYATVFGHVSEFLVTEGQRVRAGDPIASSGGIPGTPGAGRLTTGAHLHFEMLRGGTHIDPLTELPSFQAAIED